MSCLSFGPAVELEPLVATKLLKHTVLLVETYYFLISLAFRKLFDFEPICPSVNHNEDQMDQQLADRLNTALRDVVAEGRMSSNTCGHLLKVMAQQSRPGRQWVADRDLKPHVEEAFCTDGGRMQLVGAARTKKRYTLTCMYSNILYKAVSLVTPTQYKVI